MDINDGSKGSDRKVQSSKYLQFLRLFVSTQSGLKFIVCVDKSAKGSELELQISETYEQLLNRANNEEDQDVKLRAYRTKNMKHHGYQLAIPRNMTVGHFLEDRAEIECDLEPNRHNGFDFNVKLEVQQKNSFRHIQKESVNDDEEVIEPLKIKKSKSNKQSKEDQEPESNLPKKQPNLQNVSHDSSLDAFAANIEDPKFLNNKGQVKNHKNLNQVLIEPKNDNKEYTSKQINQPQTNNHTNQVTKLNRDNSQSQNESVRQTPKRKHLVEPQIEQEDEQILDIHQPNNNQKVLKSLPNQIQSVINTQGSQNQALKTQGQQKPQLQQNQSQRPIQQIQSKPQTQPQTQIQNHQIQSQTAQQQPQPQLVEDNHKKNYKKILQIPFPQVKENLFLSTTQPASLNAQKKKTKPPPSMPNQKPNQFKIDEVNISSSDEIPPKVQKIFKQVNKKENKKQNQTLNYDKNLFADL